MRGRLTGVRARAAALLATCWLAAAPALADANFEGTVDAVLLDSVRIAASEGVPEWMQVGREVQAFGWTAQVKEVGPGAVTLKLGVSRLANVKAGAAVSIRAPAPSEVDPAQCG